MTTAPLLVSVAPNGARRSRRDHPAIPLDADALALEAARCADAGARLFHLHVRTPDGAHSLAPELYREAIAAIRAAVGDRLIVQATTESCGMYDLAEQIAVVEALRPEAASLALREFLPDPAGERRFAEFIGWVEQAGILAQYILYSPAEALQLADLVDRGLVPGAPAVLFVLGRYADATAAAPTDLLAFVAAWGARGPWSVCAFGPAELRVAAAAIALGGHVRVGFENNLLRVDGTPLSGNAEQVANVAELARSTGRDLMTVDEARQLGRAPALAA